MKNIISFDSFSVINEAVENVSMSIPNNAEVKLYFFTDALTSSKIEYGFKVPLTPQEIAKGGEASKILGTIMALFKEDPDDLFKKVLAEVKKLNKKNYPAALYLVQNSPRIKTVFGKNFRTVGQLIGSCYSWAMSDTDANPNALSSVKYLAYDAWIALAQMTNGGLDFLQSVEKHLVSVGDRAERVYSDFTTVYIQRWRNTESNKYYFRNKGADSMSYKPDWR